MYWPLTMSQSLGFKGWFGAGLLLVLVVGRCPLGLGLLILTFLVNGPAVVGLPVARIVLLRSEQPVRGLFRLAKLQGRTAAAGVAAPDFVKMKTLCHSVNKVNGVAADPALI